MLKDYVKKYQRVVIVSDHVSYIASDIIYDEIVESIENVFNNKIFLTQREDKFFKYDEFYDKSNYDVVPRRIIYDNLMKEIKSIDTFVIRCECRKSINSIMDTPIGMTIPTKVLYNADLCISMVKNKLSIIKDRYQTPEKYLSGIDIRNVGKSYKLNKILKRINN